MKIGIDMVEVDRFYEKDDSFYKKIFTENEIHYARKYKNYAERFAGFFCAKEAFIKALECEKKLDMRNIEVLHFESGKPYLNLYGDARELIKEKEFTQDKSEKIKSDYFIKKIDLSISHTKNSAVAIVIIY
ncbi:MAG: holo-ACP synthase [Clostridia bacterium]|nr:holo-ACP synthase [Clostridia bacterium]